MGVASLGQRTRLCDAIANLRSARRLFTRRLFTTTTAFVPVCVCPLVCATMAACEPARARTAAISAKEAGNAFERAGFALI
eukprot:1288693-Rhodomonas_salina.1